MENVKPKAERAALRFGKALHLALAFYHARQMEKPPARYNVTTEEERRQLKEILRDDSLEYIKIQQIMGAYQVFDKGHALGVPVLVEREVCATFEAVCRVCERLDLLDHPEAQSAPGLKAIFDLVLHRQMNDKAYVIEHKSHTPKDAKQSSLPRIDWYDGEWTNNLQFQVQTILGRALFGPRFGAFILQRLKKTPPHACGRDDFEYNADSLRGIPEMLLEAHWRLQQNKERKLWDVPPAYGSCTNRRYGNCDYLALCSTRGHEQKHPTARDLYEIRARDR